MEYEDYKRAKQLQEETIPAFERLKEAVSVGTLDKKRTWAAIQTGSQ